MKSSIFYLSATLVLSLLSVSLISINQIGAYPQGPNDKSQDYSFGTISSVQTDESGKPTWIITGNWKGNILSNETATNASDVTFSANVRMIMTNGSAEHGHAITNFNVTDISEEEGARTFNGTSAINLPDGIVEGVPTSISVLGEGVISIWTDPARVEEHYGNSPIFGVVADEEGFGQGGNATSQGSPNPIAQ